MSATAPPDLIDRLADAALSAPTSAAVMSPGGALTFRDLHRRCLGAAGALAAGGGVEIAADAPAAVWLPWLAGGMLAGMRVGIAGDGPDAAAPEADTIPAFASQTAPSLVVRTSGTTGEPRVLRRDRLGWLKCFAAEAAHLDLNSADRVLTLGAAGFSLTPYAALRSMHLGCPVGVLPGVAGRTAAELYDTLTPSVIYGAPPLVMLLAQQRARRRGSDTAVRRIITGGARLTPVQAETIGAVWPNARLVTFYGAAETSFLAMNTAPDPSDPTDVGEPFPGVEVAATGDGGLSVRTPYAAVGVERADGAVAPLADADGWISLKDRGYVDAAGRVRLAGRTDDLLNVAGALVDPGPAERAIEGLPWVAEAALFTRPDAQRSDALWAAVVPAATPPADAGARVAHAGAEAMPWLSGRRVLCLDGAAVPRTGGGKLDKQGLVDIAEAAGSLRTEPTA